MNNKLIINKLIELSNKAKKYGEVPIAALIVKNDKIIASSYNTVEKDKSVLSHAEIKVINKVCKKNKNWRLDEYELYVTLEPCDMCREILKKCRIKYVYYFTKQNNNVTESSPNYNFIDNIDYFSNILKNFFKEKR